MASAAVSNPGTSNSIHRRQKKKKTSLDKTDSILKWKSDRQQQVYSSKLLRAFSQLRIRRQNSADAPGSDTRAVREAADKALAVAAQGRTRWSREILKNRIKLKFRKQKRQRASAVSVASALKRQKFGVSGLKGKNLPPVQRKVKVLGRLVPGCRKEPMPVVLEEASDYIAALQMQVRVMSALAELLSGGFSSGAAAAPPG